jgi:hypothetical protein
MSEKYSLSIVKVDDKQAINFANKTSKFVEVIFTIDGKEARLGVKLNTFINVKGWVYSDAGKAG